MKMLTSTAPPGKFHVTRLYPVLISICAALFHLGIGLVVIGYVVSSKLDGQLTDIQNVAVFIHVSLYALLVICTVFGAIILLPPFLQSTKLNNVPSSDQVTTLSSCFTALFLASVASNTLSLSLLFQKNPGAALPDSEASALTNPSVLAQGVGKCAPSALLAVHDSLLNNICKRSSTLKGLSVTLFVAVWLLLIAGAIVALPLASKLRVKEKEREKYEPKFDVYDLL